MRKKLTIYELTAMALLAAILCISSYIYIPLPISPVPITAQLLVIFMTGLLLRPKHAVLAVLVWLLLGTVGLPVFSGGRGGFGILAGPTGGFALGYLLAVFLVALISKKCRKEYQKLLILICIGIPALYVVGVTWMKIVAGLDWRTAFVTGTLPFVPWDIAKAVAAVFIARPLYPILRKDKI